MQQGKVQRGNPERFSAVTPGLQFVSDVPHHVCHQAGRREAFSSSSEPHLFGGERC